LFGIRKEDSRHVKRL